MTTMTFLQDLTEMTSAEDFLNYFGIVFDPAVVEVNRLHISNGFMTICNTLIRRTGRATPRVYNRLIRIS